MLHTLYLQRMLLCPPLHNSECTEGFSRAILNLRHRSSSGVISSRSSEGSSLLPLLQL